MVLPIREADNPHLSKANAAIFLLQCNNSNHYLCCTAATTQGGGMTNSVQKHRTRDQVNVGSKFSLGSNLLPPPSVGWCTIYHGNMMGKVQSHCP